MVVQICSQSGITYRGTVADSQSARNLNDVVAGRHAGNHYFENTVLLKSVINNPDSPFRYKSQKITSAETAIDSSKIESVSIPFGESSSP